LLEAGRAEGRKDVILEVLKDAGSLDENLEERIRGITDMDILKKLSHEAINADSIEQVQKFLDEIS
jgi:hypothetical protein